jgi:hemoglobin
MTDITDRESLVTLIDKFYERVEKDEILSPFFKGIHWEKHKLQMLDFWSLVLLDIPGYNTNLFDVHSKLPIQKAHFQRWIDIFSETVTDHFSGPLADLAITRAQILAASFSAKMK